MKIASIGYGKMGRAIAEHARAQGHEIVAIVDPHAPEATAKLLTADAIAQADLCIDCTRPDKVVDNVRIVSAAGKPIVIGTTGWYDKRNEVDAILTNAAVGGIYAQNFSIGMNFFLKILENAAQLVDHLDDYDVSGVELHHNQKVDSPSGTAEAICETLLKHIRRKETPCYDKLQEKISDKQLHMASVRCGSIPGTHTVYLDSSFDTITLTHQTRNRDGLAKGALLAADWIRDKSGLHHISEIF